MKLQEMVYDPLPVAPPQNGTTHGKFTHFVDCTCKQMALRIKISGLINISTEELSVLQSRDLLSYPFFVVPVLRRLVIIDLGLGK